MTVLPLPDGFEFGEVVRNLGLWCIRRNRAQLMLCGREVRQVPPRDWWPLDWAEVHRDCVQALAALTAPVREARVCPACGGAVGVVDGRVQPHFDGGVPCVGVNMAPRGRR